MGTTADKLEYLQGTKAAIKSAIINKGVAVPDGTTFRAYADKIAEISGTSFNEISISVPPNGWFQQSGQTYYVYIITDSFFSGDESLFFFDFEGVKQLGASGVGIIKTGIQVLLVATYGKPTQQIDFTVYKLI